MNWKATGPTKVKTLSWLVAHHKMNICDMVQRRRLITCLPFSSGGLAGEIGSSKIMWCGD